MAKTKITKLSDTQLAAINEDHSSYLRATDISTLAVASTVYTKAEVESLICSAVAGSATDFSNLSSVYYTKSQVYNTAEVNTKLSAKQDALTSKQLSTINDTYYNQTAIDTSLALKADKSDTYTKNETQSLISSAITGTSGIVTYTKNETDDLLASKADSSVVYTKTESDAKYIPLVGATLTQGFAFKGPSGYTRDVIQIYGTDSATGDAIVIGAGGLTVIGGGESAKTVRDGTGSSPGAEKMIIAGDGNIDFYTNCDSSFNTAKHTYIDTNGNFVGNVTGTASYASVSGSASSAGTAAGCSGTAQYAVKSGSADVSATSTYNTGTSVYSVNAGTAVTTTGTATYAVKAGVAGTAGYTTGTAQYAVKAGSATDSTKLPLTGGTMTSGIKFSSNWPLSKTNTYGYLEIDGGTGYTSGAFSYVVGKDYTGSDKTAGSFGMVATDSTNWSYFIGKPDGTLTWNNKNVSLEGHTHSYLPLTGGTMTGVMVGTASYASKADSASNASIATSANVASTATYTSGTSVYALNADSASNASLANTAVYCRGTSVYALNAGTATYAPNYLPLKGGTITGIIQSDYGKSVIDGTVNKVFTATMAENDSFFLATEATAKDAGAGIIATLDNGNEPIYVRQYTTSGFTSKTPTHQATLLDASGKTAFPVSVTAPSFIGNVTGNVTGSITGSATYATKAGIATDSTKLPLTGGTMTGLIVGTASYAIKTETASNASIATTANIANTASYTSGTSVYAVNAGTAVTTTGTSTYAVNAGTATTAPDYLPLAGGTMTGEIHSNTNALLRTVNDTAFAEICGGKESGTSPYVAVMGTASTSNPGAFVLKAHDGVSTSSILLGKPDGTLQWNGSKIDLSINDTSYLRKTNNTNAFFLQGGTAYNQGSFLRLNGGSQESQPGYFQLGAFTDGSGVNLFGKPDGSLMWNSKDVVTVQSKTSFTMTAKSGYTINIQRCYRQNNIICVYLSITLPSITISDGAWYVFATFPSTITNDLAFDHYWDQPTGSSGNNRIFRICDTYGIGGYLNSADAGDTVHISKTVIG